MHSLGRKVTEWYIQRWIFIQGFTRFCFKSIPINVSHSLGDDEGGDELSDTSGESVRVEHAYQPSPNTSYKSGSIIPIEAGQLVAAMMF